MALKGSSNWLSLSFYKTKSTAEGSNSSHLPGREGKGVQTLDHLSCWTIVWDVCRKSCDGGEDGYVHVWHTPHAVLVLILCTNHYFTTHKLIPTDTHTHTFSDWNAVLVMLLLTLSVFFVFGNRHQSTWRLIINSPGQSWPISGSVELLLKRHLPRLVVASLEGVWISPWAESKVSSQHSGRSRNNLDTIPTAFHVSSATYLKALVT